MNSAIFRVYVDHMEPLLDDKQMILIQQEQPAGSKCNEQQSLSQVIQSEQLENQWGGPSHHAMFQIHVRGMAKQLVCLSARRAPTVKQWSLDARSGDHTSRLAECG
jgi:hypothetical protein